MIQDIFPSKLNNQFECAVLSDDDFVFVFDREGRVLLGENGENESDDSDNETKKSKKARFLKGRDLGGCNAVYLFSMDEKRFFLATDVKDFEKEGFSYYTIREARDNFGGKEIFATFTAYHLNKWYTDNVFCGRCGSKTVPSEKERALKCPGCGNVIYPRINPAVIVGVIKGDKILITRYNRGYAHNALVAGFAEIGETLEETVAREVMEETGVKVKNIRYYKSQPWGMAEDILTGFFCEADGEGRIVMDENELKYAEWVERKDIVLQPNNLSLTNEMMRIFKEGKISL